MRKKKIIMLAIGCGLFSCGQSLYIPKSPDAAKQKQLVDGRTIYIAHCGSCHNLYRPTDFTAPKWQKNLDEMQVRAKITDAEKNLVYEYLIAHP